MLTISVWVVLSFAALSSCGSSSRTAWSPCFLATSTSSRAALLRTAQPSRSLPTAPQQHPQFTLYLRILVQQYSDNPAEFRVAHRWPVPCCCTSNV